MINPMAKNSATMIDDHHGITASEGSNLENSVYTPMTNEMNKLIAPIKNTILSGYAENDVTALTSRINLSRTYNLMMICANFYRHDVAFGEIRAMSNFLPRKDHNYAVQAVN